MTACPRNGIRHKMLSAFNVWMEIPQAELAIISNVVDMLHNASLMLDDIEDRSN
ncbi:hypothetical protein DFH09DRAFT_280447 [Mycena vulgaris]|nr:hypothetical protein DFH09DRAFT_280447 [Mycena vulgaris]